MALDYKGREIPEGACQRCGQIIGEHSEVLVSFAMQLAALDAKLDRMADMLSGIMAMQEPFGCRTVCVPPVANVPGQENWDQWCAYVKHGPRKKESP